MNDVRRHRSQASSIYILQQEQIIGQCFRCLGDFLHTDILVPDHECLPDSGRKSLPLPVGHLDQERRILPERGEDFDLNVGEARFGNTRSDGFSTWMSRTYRSYSFAKVSSGVNSTSSPGR